MPESSSRPMPAKYSWRRTDGPEMIGSVRSTPTDSGWSYIGVDGSGRGVKRLHFSWGFQICIQTCCWCCSLRDMITNMAGQKQLIPTTPEPTLTVLPNGPITQLSTYFTRNPCILTHQTHQTYHCRRPLHLAQASASPSPSSHPPVARPSPSSPVSAGWTHHRPPRSCHFPSGHSL